MTKDQKLTIVRLISLVTEQAAKKETTTFAEEMLNYGKDLGITDEQIIEIQAVPLTGLVEWLRDG